MVIFARRRAIIIYGDLCAAGRKRRKFKHGTRRDDSTRKHATIQLNAICLDCRMYFVVNKKTTKWNIKTIMCATIW